MSHIGGRVTLRGLEAFQTVKLGLVPQGKGQAIVVTEVAEGSRAEQVRARPDTREIVHTPHAWSDVFANFEAYTEQGAASDGGATGVLWWDEAPRPVRAARGCH